MASRRAFTAAVALVLLVGFPIVASATCVSQPMDQVIRASDAVWWGHVTKARVVTPPKSEGTWILTVRLDDVVKGPGSAGDTATVVESGCGPPTTPEQQRKAAPTFVGEQRLFIGNIDAGALVAFPEVITPTGLSAQEQYTLASSLVHHEPIGVPTGRPWWWVAIVVLAGLSLAVAITIVIRRRALS